MAASHFGLMLRQLRKDKRATLSEVAAATGISVPMLSRMERGERLPSSEKLMALAHYYGTSSRVLAEAASQQHSLNRYSASLSEEMPEPGAMIEVSEPWSMSAPARSDALQSNILAPSSERAAFRARPIEALFDAEAESPSSAVEDATVAAETAVRQLGRELRRSAPAMSESERGRAREEVRKLGQMLDAYDAAGWWAGP